MGTEIRIPEEKLLLHEIAEAYQRGIPLRGDRFEILACLAKAAAFQLPYHLAALPSAADEPGAFHRAQVFGDGLSRDRQAGAECRKRSGTAGAETRN